jgi:amidase
MNEISVDELQSAARRVGMHFTTDEEHDGRALAQWMLDEVDSFVEHAKALTVQRQRIAGVRRVLGAPTPGEDPYNAILRWAEVEADASERSSELLAGKNIALKDLISVAGLPLTGASEHLEGYLPDEDATVVSRILRAGGRIVAFTNMEGMAFGGGGESGCFGATRNPFDMTRSTSGSSGGSAAALFYDGIDIAFGSDQGGSIRQPASWCGVIGLKPSHGLVPYTGIMSHDPTIDHVGPMARTVSDVALALEAVAGWTADDPRQSSLDQARVGGYTFAVADAPDSLAGLRFGVLAEALMDDGSADRGAVLEGFREARRKLEALGAELVEISIPSHAVAGSIMFAIMLEGITATLSGFGEGYHWSGRHSPTMRRAFGEGLRARGEKMPVAYRTAGAVGEFLRVRDFGNIYAVAQNFATTLRSDYDRAFESVDVILMPTTPGTAMELMPDAGILERQLRSFTMGSSLGADTPAHNLTGHPALSMPASEAAGMPSGVMLVGPKYSDARLLSVARVWEKQIGWLPRNQPAPVGDGGAKNHRAEEQA